MLILDGWRFPDARALEAQRAPGDLQFEAIGTHVRFTSSDVGQWEAEDPEEVFARPPPDMGPERRLRWDVFVDGIRLVMGVRGGSGSKKEIREAARWILSENRNDAFSFEILAEDFGLEPSVLRRKLSKGFALKEKAQKTTLGRTRT